MYAIARMGLALSMLLVAFPIGSDAQVDHKPLQRLMYLFTLDLRGTPLDEFPDGVKALNGVMTVVDKDGQHMLKASSPSELLITLPQPLPAEFTVELEFIPKRCCNPDDIMVEGTPSRNRGVASVELTWHPDRISAVGGGGEMYQSNMPDDLAASTPGTLTRVVVEVRGTTIKLYTNGRRLYTLEKQFTRGRVLRVGLGGESEGNPMYLAGLRIGSGPASADVIAGNTGPSDAGGGMRSPQDQPRGAKTETAGFAKFVVTSGSDAGATLNWSTTASASGPQLGGFRIERRVVGGPFSALDKAFTILADFDFTLRDEFSAQVGTRYEYQIKELDRSGSVIATSTIEGFEVPGSTDSKRTESNQQASTGSMLPTMVANVTIAQSAAGPVVNWLPVAVPAVYSVKRWKLDDPACCTNASPPSPVLSGPPWQDAPLTVAGTYVYEVTATMNGGVATGQAQFAKLATGSRQIATTETGPAPVTGVVATQTGTITPIQGTTPVLPAPSSLPTVAPAPPPPPPPIVTTPRVSEPKTAGASTLLLGPATLTATPRQGWGVVLAWPEVVNGAYYAVERGPSAQSFALLTTIVPQFNPPQAGTYSFEDVSGLPGSTSFYRIKAEFSNGTFAYSPVARFDAPTQVAQVTNLTASKQGPCDVNSPVGSCTPPVPNSTGYQHWLVTWSWVPVPGTLTQEYRDEFMLDPSKGFQVSLGGTWHAGSSPTYQQTFTVGFVTKVRFCISLIRPISNADPITNGTCVVTDLP